MIHCLNPLVSDLKLEGKRVGEVVTSANITNVTNHNIAKDVLYQSQLHTDTPAYSMVKGCISSLEATINIANKIAFGSINNGIVIGGESLSDVRIECTKKASN